MTDQHIMELQDCIDSLKSNDVDVLRKSVRRLGELKDVRAVEPLLDIWFDEERMGMLHNPEDWDRHIVKDVLISIGSPAIPLLKKNLERHWGLIHVIADIRDEQAAEVLLSIARQSAANTHYVNAAWLHQIPINAQSSGKIDPNDAFAQAMINGLIEMACNESIVFWEYTAEEIFYYLTEKQFQYLVLHMPETRRTKLIELHDVFIEKETYLNKQASKLEQKAGL
jgi:hypothetical protein